MAIHTSLAQKAIVKLLQGSSTIDGRNLAQFFGIHPKPLSIKGILNGIFAIISMSANWIEN